MALPPSVAISTRTRMTGRTTERAEMRNLDSSSSGIRTLTGLAVAIFIIALLYVASPVQAVFSGTSDSYNVSISSLGASGTNGSSTTYEMRVTQRQVTTNGSTTSNDYFDVLLGWLRMALLSNISVHFSPTPTPEPTPTPTPVETAATGGGGGGGGMLIPALTLAVRLISPATIPDPFTRITATISDDPSLSDPQITAGSITFPEISVPLPPGIIYAYSELTRNFDASYIVSVEFDFKVNGSWVSSNDIGLSTIALYSYEDDAWRKVLTVRTGQDANSYSFSSSANTTTFSLLAITGFKKPSVAVTLTPTASPTPEKTAVPGLPEIEKVLPPPEKALRLPITPFFFAMALLVALIYLWRRHVSVLEARMPKVRGYVTDYFAEGFEITDGKAFISVRFAGGKPEIGSWVVARGTFVDRTHFTAVSARPMEMRTK